MTIKSMMNDTRKWIRMMNDTRRWMMIVEWYTRGWIRVDELEWRNDTREWTIMEEWY